MRGSGAAGQASGEQRRRRKGSAVAGTGSAAPESESAPERTAQSGMSSSSLAWSWWSSSWLASWSWSVASWWWSSSLLSSVVVVVVVVGCVVVVTYVVVTGGCRGGRRRRWRRRWHLAGDRHRSGGVVGGGGAALVGGGGLTVAVWLRGVGAVGHARQRDRHTADGDQRDGRGQAEHQLRQPLPCARLLDRPGRRHILHRRAHPRDGRRRRDSRRCTAQARRSCRRPATTPAPWPPRSWRSATGAAPVWASAAGATPVCASAAEPYAANTRGPDRRVQRGLRSRHDRRFRVFRQSLGDQRNARTAAHSDNRGNVLPTNPVVLQRIFQRRKDTREWSGDQRLQLGSRNPNPGPVSRKFGDELGDRLRGQPLLGKTTFLPQPGERPHRGGACRVNGACPRDSVEHVTEQRLIDLVSGEIRVPRRLADRLERRRGVGQCDARAAATEIQQHHHAVWREAGVGLQCASVRRRHPKSAARACRWERGPDSRRSASRKAARGRGPQCAGTAMAMSAGDRPLLAFTSGAIASTNSRSARWVDPSGATIGTVSPTRSTKPLSIMPLARVSTERRVTG